MPLLIFALLSWLESPGSAPRARGPWLVLALWLASSGAQLASAYCSFRCSCVGLRVRAALSGPSNRASWSLRRPRF